jgi:Na+-driven multidrug efflux pump
MNSMSIGRGSGHTAFPTTIDIIRNWGITIALGYILAFTFHVGSIGIWLASRPE